jgi:PAS domain S-box-containing protein
MRLATERAGIATWDISARTDSRSSRAVTWSPQFYALLGYHKGEVPPSIENWLARLRHDEREALSGALEAALAGRAPLALEQWVLRPDGAEYCVAVYGTMHHGASGEPDRLIGVAMDVTERRRVEAQREALLDQARAAQAAAEEAARMKDEFLAMLSHELRTPMSAVLGWLHLVRGGQLSPEQQDKALATIERNARQQTQLVNDLLDVSRIVTRKLERDAGHAALDKVLAAAVESARPAAEARGIAIALDIADGHWVVQGSAARLEQVFSNLLSNAIKFSGEGQAVEVALGRLDRRAQVVVRDYGEGLSAQVLPRIFDTFRQADSSSRRRHGGLGLGLAIVKSLVEVHGGTVKAESEGSGHGAAFTVLLPLAENGAVQGTSAEQAAASLQGLRLLVVDDEPDHLEMTSQMLRLEGATVATACGAQEALRAVCTDAPDVVVLDIAMPGVDGYELLRTLRAAAKGALPAIALTGYASPNDAARAAAAGFEYHLAKPFELQALREQIARLARRRS